MLAACVGAALATSASATTAIVVDVDSGAVLHAERADQPWYPASITKLMTAYVAFDVLAASPDIAEDTPARWSDHANAQEPTKLWLRTGTELPLGIAVGAMIVKSANDAATMVAETVGGALADFTRYGACRATEGVSHRDDAGVRVFDPAPDPMDRFAKRTSGLGAARFDDARTPWVACRHDAFIAQMNATARRLGMTQTRFVNANGLPHAGQVTTARDFAKLARALIRDHPRYAP
ncbi:MAG: serine hydrolase, partial [Pseudomonadota bacterium]